MLLSHFNAIENVLLQKFKIPANSGHSLHKGTPRETFIREFLQDHLSELIGIGTGEIIDKDSKPKTQRNQNDIVLYRKNFPTIDFGSGIKAFLAESVVATIEVKSTLTEDELKNSFNSIINTKKLTRKFDAIFSSGYVPPSILSVIIAYDGPANMDTVKGWIDKYNTANNISYPVLPLKSNEREKVISPLADLIIVLGKGFIKFDNGPFTFYNTTSLEDLAIQLSNRQISIPNFKWIISSQKENNLVILFTLLTMAISGTLSLSTDISPYLTHLRISDFKVHE